MTIDSEEARLDVLSKTLFSRWFNELILEVVDYTEGAPHMIKRGTEVWVEEGEIAEWVRTNTAVPVPKVRRQDEACQKSELLTTHATGLPCCRRWQVLGH